MGDVKTTKVPFLRNRKKGRQLCHPYTPPPPTTPRRSKRCRASSRVYKSAMQALTETDENDIQLEPWVEVCIHITLKPFSSILVSNNHLTPTCFTGIDSSRRFTWRSQSTFWDNDVTAFKEGDEISASMG